MSELHDECGVVAVALGGARVCEFEFAAPDDCLHGIGTRCVVEIAKDHQPVPSDPAWKRLVDRALLEARWAGRFVKRAVGLQ